VIRDAWDRTEMSVIDLPCASLPVRVEPMMEASGQTIQPFMGSHGQSVPAEYLLDRTHLTPPPPWTLHEDEDLICIRTRRELLHK
jgi:hypothetical protein